MAQTISPPDRSPLKLFVKDTLIKGRPGQIECVDLLGQTYSISKGALTTISLEDEWYEDVRDPEAVIAILKEQREFTPDIFTFWQRLPDLVPRYGYHQEWDDIAVLSSHSYKDWFDKHIKSRVRSQIRKSEKEGVVVRETAYDDDFVRGMAAIFNEAPIRQGRRFWHYGKDFETIKHQFSRYIHREHMIGAYFRDELIGFIMLGNAGTFGITGQIISSIKHRDKATNNALIAKAVQVCEQLGLAHLVYLFWSDDSLSEFKRRCGFERTQAPRYFVPLSTKGRIAITANLHRGWRTILPTGVKHSLKQMRSAWNERHERQEKVSE
jgi:hypothetical protein